MDIFRKLFKPKAPMPATCPNSEYLSENYWCDMGHQRVRISNLAFTYADIKPDHVERVCKGRYTSCPLYQASLFPR